MTAREIAELSGELMEIAEAWASAVEGCKSTMNGKPVLFTNPPAINDLVAFLKDTAKKLNGMIPDDEIRIDS